MMKKLRLITILGLVCLFSVTNAQNINSEKSKATFKIENMKVKVVEGSFHGMTGNIVFNESDLSNSTFDICIKASTLNTGNEKRDDHLRTEDFFHVEKYPVICFNSESISRTSTGFVTKGKLTMHGVTKTFEIPFTFDGIQFRGELILNRLDFNIGNDTNTFMVSNKVVISIFCTVNLNS